MAKRLALAAFIVASAWAQDPATTGIETFKIYTEHPRLFLRPNRLRLLRRERERKSLRWEQFETLVKGNAPAPETGITQALYYRITDDAEAGRKAVNWALSSSGTDLHQLALVFDWCQEAMSPAQTRALAARLEKGLSDGGNSFESARSRLLAGIALADQSSLSEPSLSAFYTKEWTPRIAQSRAGRDAWPRRDAFALYEVLHAVRDNLNADLREQFPRYFKDLPIAHLLSHYPAPYPAAENEYHIPFTNDFAGAPNLKEAALSRVAELEMVAFDSNAPESQVLQGWLMNDRFLLRGLLGNTYELLWANPYQPGLSYYHVPLVFHDELFGRLYVRSSWEDTADWAGFSDGRLQFWHDGRITRLNPDLSREPLDLEEAMVFFGKQASRFQLPDKEVNDAFVVGVQPNRTYRVEIDDEELREEVSDPGGILYFPGVHGGAGIRFSAGP